jgi:hypothetical protein
MKKHKKILKLAIEGKLPKNISEDTFPDIDIFEELFDRELIKASDISSTGGKAYINPKITLKGREYYETLKPTRNKTVFISCGQQTENEKQLGNSIQDLVRELTPFEPYFAEFHTSLEGLSKNIFRALNQSAGFIAVMHQRGYVNPPGDVFRASVWVEQEIAIAAFLHSALGKHINIAAYIQPGIALEGARQQLLLNPRVFENNNDVLEHLSLILPTWQAPLEPEEASEVDVDIVYDKVKITGERHDYRLVVLLTNRGKETIDDYHVDLEFPTSLIEKPEEEYHYEGTRSTEKRSFFRATRQQIGRSIFPGDTLRVITLPYYIDDDIYFNRHYLLKENARAVIYSKGREPMSLEKSISQLQNYWTGRWLILNENRQ